jgi:hypothetical protein
VHRVLPSMLAPAGSSGKAPGLGAEVAASPPYHGGSSPEACGGLVSVRPPARSDAVAHKLHRLEQGRSIGRRTGMRRPRR